MITSTEEIDMTYQDFLGCAIWVESDADLKAYSVAFGAYVDQLMSHGIWA